MGARENPEMKQGNGANFYVASVNAYKTFSPLRARRFTKVKSISFYKIVLLELGLSECVTSAQRSAEFSFAII